MTTALLIGVLFALIPLIPIGIMTWLYNREAPPKRTTDTRVHYEASSPPTPTAEELRALQDEERRRFDALIRRWPDEQSRRA